MCVCVCAHRSCPWLRIMQAFQLIDFLTGIPADHYTSQQTPMGKREGKEEKERERRGEKERDKILTNNLIYGRSVRATMCL